MGTQVKFNKGTKSKIDAEPISDGALYLSTDTKELFIDSGTQRISIGGTQVPTITDTEIDTIFDTVFNS